MARLPDLDNLGARPIPRARMGVASVDNPGAIGSAIEGFGKTAARIGAAEVEKEDQLSYAAAKATLLKADIEARQELAEDPDYETAEKRYQDRMSKAQSAASSLIKSKFDRKVFDVDTRTDLDRGSFEIRKIATNKRQAAETAGFASTLLDLQAASRLAKDDATREVAIKTATDAIAGAQAKGLLTPEKALEARQKWTEEYVYGQAAIALDAGDTEKAKGVVERFGQYLGTDSFLKLNAALNGEVEAQKVMTAANAAMGRPLVQSPKDVPGLVTRLFPGARITSTKRDPNSPLGKANPGSHHNDRPGKGTQAIDVAPVEGVTFDQYVTTLKANGIDVIEARDEVKNPSKHATGPHWHVAYRVGGGGDPYPEFPVVRSAGKSQWGSRSDGSSKGDGFLGARRRPDGSVSTEISIGVEIGGKEVEIPTMVPGLTGDELRWLMTTPPDQIAGAIPQSIITKAVGHAKARMAEGKSPFKEDGEPVAVASVAVGPPATLEDAISRGVAALGPDATPALIEKTRGEIAKRWQVAEVSERDREDDAVENVQALLLKNGGNWYALPASVRGSVSPKHVPGLIQYGNSLQTGTKQETDASEYVRLTEMAATNPKEFAKINPITYRGSFDDTDWERVVALRNEILGKTDKGTAPVPLATVRSVAGPMLEARGLTLTGIAPQQKVARQAMASRIYGFEKSIMTDVGVWQRNNPGKAISALDIQGMADRRLLSALQNGEERFQFELQPGVPAKVRIPAAVRSRIASVGRDRLGREPTEQEIVQAYLREARGG